MKKKTATDAAKKLPREARQPFLRAWKAANRMDLYIGNLEDYLSVMGQVLQERQNDINCLEKEIKKIKKNIIKAIEVRKKNDNEYQHY